MGHFDSNNPQTLEREFSRDDLPNRAINPPGRNGLSRSKAYTPHGCLNSFGTPDPRQVVGEASRHGVAREDGYACPTYSNSFHQAAREKKMNLRFVGRRTNCCTTVSLWAILTRTTREPRSFIIRFVVEEGIDDNMSQIRAGSFSSKESVGPISVVGESRSVAEKSVPQGACFEI